MFNGKHYRNIICRFTFFPQGLSDFQGQVVHTHDYRVPKGYEDKRIVVVGIGNSGADVAVELSCVASQVSWRLIDW